MVHDSQLPTTVTQLAGHGIASVVGGLTPAMLGVLLLNVVGIGAAIYFLNLLISGQQQHLRSLLVVQQSQITQVLRTHDREFDALMAMVLEQIREAAKEPPPPPPQEDVLPLPTPRP